MLQPMVPGFEAAGGYTERPRKREVLTGGEPIKILHVDRDYRLMLFVIMDGRTIKSRVPLEQGVAMLKKEAL